MGLNDFDIEGLDELKGNLKQLAEKGVKEVNRGLERLNGLEPSEKSQVPENCPYCGAKLPINDESATIVCEYCSAKFDNSKAKSIADSVFDFVEKQQKIDLEKKQAALEAARLKMAEKKIKRRKGSAIRFLLLIMLIFAILYVYFIQLGGVIPGM